MSITPHGLNESDVDAIRGSRSSWNTHSSWLKKFSDSLHTVKRNLLSEQSFDGSTADDVRSEIKAIATEFEEASAQALELSDKIDEHGTVLSQAHQDIEWLLQELSELGLGLDSDGDVILVAELDENGNLPGGETLEGALDIAHKALDPIMGSAQKANDELDAEIRGAIGNTEDWR